MVLDDLDGFAREEVGGVGSGFVPDYLMVVPEIQPTILSMVPVILSTSQKTCTVKQGLQFSTGSRGWDHPECGPSNPQHTPTKPVQ